MQFPESTYELLDFGAERKLERLGDRVVDRPCPGATAKKNAPEIWQQATLSYGLKSHDQWHSNKEASPKATSEPWSCDCGGIRMLLKPTPAGQVGVFPEHWAHWPWLRSILKLDGLPMDRAPRVLSLFAYTGATTLVLAKAGCCVTHVDASKPTVAWARENAAFSGLTDASIRWIVEDASAFVKRELRRNSQYEAIILDPPTYGHGAKGTRWEIHRHLMPLLEDCWQLLSNDRRGVLLCGHSSHIAIRDINSTLVQRHGSASVKDCEIHKAGLIDRAGRKLDCGFAARYSF
jgi:23S rRNA (cytosine1962-C5)-methyltransferase